jgi:outer membrane protein OmpA-like peptidoglycan-associated protein
MLNRSTRIVFLAALFWVFGWTGISAQETKYAIGFSGGMVYNYGGDFFSFKPSYTLGGHLRYHPGGRWFLDLNYDHFTLNNDETKDSAGSIGIISNNNPLRFKSDRIGLSLGRYLFPRYHRANISLSLDGALLMWKITDPVGDTTVHVQGSKNEYTTLSATELAMGGTLGLSYFLAQNLCLTLSGRAEYLTGAGAEFEPAVSSSRDRWLMSARAGLSLHFGRPTENKTWPSDSAWSVSDAHAKSRKKLNGPDNRAATTDSDRDGVFDLYDDCPGTPAEAAGMVDIHGCPIDADFDGVPNHKDSCPGTMLGATVDSAGCAVDSDGDSIPDGLDDCPDSPVGVPVDRFGCIDLSMFSKPIILNIDYLPGSFEIDLKTKDRLKKIAGVLLLVPEVRMDIVGYTDNIGLPEANQKLSEKRANRVRDYLVAMGVAADRMKSFGRGEENQISSNDTAQGRNRNRRIEITFYR